MNNSPLVSLIIRTKNEERWLSSCLGAVFSQRYKAFEVILVDNESTDKTVEKARQYPIKKIVTISNFLPGRALNLGIEESKGKYIVRVDSDDYVNENFLFLLNEFLEQNKYMDAVACDYFLVDE